MMRLFHHSSFLGSRNYIIYLSRFILSYLGGLDFVTFMFQDFVVVLYSISFRYLSRDSLALALGLALANSAAARSDSFRNSNTTAAKASG